MAVQLSVAEATARTPGRLVPVVASGVVGAAGLAVLARVDPNQPGHYPLCPLKAFTGLDCPWCGSLRAVHSLLHGDVLTALDHNVLTVVTLPLAVALWVSWAVGQARGRPARLTLSPRAMTALLVLFLVFGVVRNLPGVPYLGSGVG